MDYASTQTQELNIHHVLDISKSQDEVNIIYGVIVSVLNLNLNTDLYVLLNIEIKYLQ